MAVLVLLVALVLGVIARAAVRRPARGRPVWVVALAGGELAGWFLMITAAVIWSAWAIGWADGWIGTVALVILGAALVAFMVALARGFAAGTAVLRQTGSARRRPPALSAVMPLARRPRGVETTPALRYGPHERHLVDVTRSARPEGPMPVLVHVHGGGWLRGRRHTQARPLVYRLARAGWAVLTPSYRLSPEATFPDHLVDVKRVIAWARAQAEELSVDPAFIAVAGGSTGGNLAALAALTAGDSRLQPGFEAADTSVQACVPLYGVHDLLRRDGRPLWPYLVSAVMKSEPGTDPEAWERASPTRMANGHGTPFVVIHGTHDTLVGPGQSRRLVEALTAAGGPLPIHLEVRHGNHGFDYFAGPRGRATAMAVETVLDRLATRGT